MIVIADVAADSVADDPRIGLLTLVLVVVGGDRFWQIVGFASGTMTRPVSAPTASLKCCHGNMQIKPASIQFVCLSTCTMSAILL